MSDILINTAALVNNDKTGPYIKVGKAPLRTPTEDQLLIKAIAFAINPTDWKQIDHGHAKTNAVAGSDVSGIVESVGANVQGFKKGDYVSTFVHGDVELDRGGFERFVVADPIRTINYNKLFPEKALSVGDHPSGTISTFEGAASITLGVCTVGLSFAGNLGISSTRRDNADKYILIWGGATATGILAIQIAKHIYGLNVVITASKKNHEYLKSLGADVTLDYEDDDVLDQLNKFDFSYGLDAVSIKQTFQQIYDATNNSKYVKLDNLFLLTEKDIVTSDDRKDNVEFVPVTVVYIVVGQEVKSDGVTRKIDDETLKRYNEFWYELLPSFIPKLKHANLKVLKEGFDSVNEGFYLLKDNKVSAQKVVFRA